MPGMGSCSQACCILRAVDHVREDKRKHLSLEQRAPDLDLDCRGEVYPHGHMRFVVSVKLVEMVHCLCIDSRQGRCS